MAWLDTPPLPCLGDDALARKTRETQRVRNQLQRRRVLRVWSCALRILLTTDRRWRRRLQRFVRLWQCWTKHHRAGKCTSQAALKIQDAKDVRQRRCSEATANSKILRRVLQCWKHAVSKRIGVAFQLSDEVQNQKLHCQLQAWRLAHQKQLSINLLEFRKWQKRMKLQTCLKGWRVCACHSSRHRQCQAAELQRRLQCQQFAAQLLKSWRQLMHLARRKRDESASMVISQAVSVMQSAWTAWMGLLDICRECDEVAEQWCHAMVLDGCRAALHRWHQAASLYRSSQVLQRRRQLQHARCALRRWQDLIREQQRMAALIDACHEKRSRLAQRRVIFELFQQAQIKSYSRQLLSLAGEKAKHLLLGFVKSALQSWSTYAQQRQRLLQYVAAFRMRQAHFEVHRLLHRWRCRHQETRQRQKLQRLSDGCWRRVAKEAARLWLRAAHRVAKRSHELQLASDAKIQEVFEEIQKRSFQAWETRTQQQRKWRYRCRRASEELAIRRCGHALLHLRKAAALTRYGDQLRDVVSCARSQRALRLWFGLSEVSRQQRSAQVQMQKAFLSRLRLRCRQSKLSKAAVCYDCRRLEGLAFVSWQTLVQLQLQKSRDL